MQIIFHAGVHATDEERLIKCLLRNKERLSTTGVAVPGPGKYRQILKEAFQALETAAPAPGARDVLMDAILDQEIADRMILSNSHFFGSQRHALAEGLLYPYAPERLVHMKRLFGFDQLELFMAIRNPASFVPAVLGNASPKRLREVMGAVDPRDLHWSTTLQRIRDTVPDVPLTVWCNEDLPLIWGQVIREMAGLEMGDPIDGAFDMVAELMTKEGMTRFNAYIAQHPDMNEMQLRRVIAAFLDKFVRDDALEEELDLPGWTEDLVDDLTDAYDEDVFRIQRIPGVNFITP